MTKMITVLAAVACPILLAAEEHGRRVVCLSNSRELRKACACTQTSGIIIYRDLHAKWPNTEFVIRALREYVGTLSTRR